MGKQAKRGNRAKVGPGPGGEVGLAGMAVL